MGEFNLWGRVRHLTFGMAVCATMAASLSMAAASSAAQAQPETALQVFAPEAIAGIAPNNGSVLGGTVVTITGSGFSANTVVMFGPVAAGEVSVRSSTSITAVSPPGSGLVQVSVLDLRGASSATPYDAFAYDPLPRGPWLGLNGNSVTYLGPVGQFARDHLVYDRDEYGAGELPGPRDPLARAIHNHMSPDVVIDYAGYTGRNWGRRDPHFPRGGAIARYVSGFVATVTAILRRYPGRRILFEPINEPYGYATAGDYAAVIARLLPAARRAGIPLDTIYVAAYGKAWVSAMYAAQPSLHTLVQGWYFHPYGPATGTAYEYTAGIQAIPHVQGEMSSGQSNIVVSEIGWCAANVNPGATCSEPRVSSARESALMLTASLKNALPMRRAGWLRALLVYSRNDGGWAMELPKGILTEPGRALLRFARAHPES